ncbi:MAG: sigma-54-dependent Fis family transcriptional regulator [bacterium]|nr:sigma-54-dependent Fis family transcriptional regulator [bacterium]
MMDGRRILVVDDESGMRAGLVEVLTRGGGLVEAAASAEEALERLERGGIELLVTDLRLPGRSGLELLRETRRAELEVPAIVITAHGTIEDAVAAMKLGAIDFLQKPFSPGDLLHLATRALAERSGPAPAPRRGRGEGVRRPIVSHDPAVMKLLEVAENVASSRAPVLIQGESGTGKELLARYIHDAGSRRGRPFVAVNCAALPRDLLESELFGHERGAFTGALTRKTGKFELANGGTILLDEIGEMEPALQAKLLRVLQEYEVDRVGGTAPVPIDVRVVATTNRRLRDMVDRGTFREDLFYRLAVIPLTMPSLRDRKGDIDLLAEHFVKRFASGRPRTLSDAARAVLRERAWPGNVRELEHAIERAVLLCAGTEVTAEELLDREPAPQRMGAGMLAGLTVREMERRLILETLQRTNQNRTHAARLLGISIRTLRNKLAEYRRHGELGPEAAGAEAS